MRKFASVLCAATALGSSPAWAQEAPSAIANENRTTTEPSQPDTATSTGQSQSGDIVVTAQRRSERLIDVPIAVTAVTPEQMASGGVTTATDLDRITPGLLMATQASHAQPNIRGVGSALTGPGADNNVAVYIDGVYQASQSSLILDFNNVEQIEVLKGPQGTLFGRNATGGAITIKTLDPGFSRELRVNASYGGYRDFRANGYVNVPLVDDKLAFNIAGLYRAERGYIRNLFNGKIVPGVKDHAVDAKLLFKPASNFRMILSGFYSDRRDEKNDTLEPYNGPTAYFTANPQFRVPGPYETNQNEEATYRTHVRSTNLRTELEVAPGTFSTITAYTKYFGDLGFDIDQSPLAIGFSAIHDYSRTFSQEINFASKNFGSFSFVAGLFYYNDIAGRDQAITSLKGQGTPFFETVTSVHTRAYAAYTEVNVDLSDRLHAIAGIRYSSETKDGTGRRVYGLGAPVAPHHTWDAFTPRVALRYELSPQDNVYASFSKGFKSGVFNVEDLQAEPVDPENINAYEIGFKSSHRGFRFNASAFYYKYSDIQVQSQLNALQLIYQNAAKATIYGGDFDVSLDVTDDLRVTGGLAYTHGRYDKFPGALTTTRDATTGVTTILGFLDQSGSVTIRTPEFAGNIGLAYEHQFDSGKFGATSTISYIDKYFVGADNRAFVPSTTQLSGELSWTTADDRFRFAVWGKNLTNEKRLLFLTGGSLDLAIYDVPRTYGVSVGVKLK